MPPRRSDQLRCIHYQILPSLLVNAAPVAAFVAYINHEILPGPGKIKLITGAAQKYGYLPWGASKDLEGLESREKKN